MRMQRIRIHILLLAVLLAGSLRLTVTAEELFLQPDTWIPTAGVVLDGEAPQSGHFRFRLLDGEGNLLAEAENVGRSVAFPAYSYAESGSWTYYLKAVCDENTEIQYDRAVYTATVELTGQETLAARVSWKRNGKPYSGIPQFSHRAITENPKTGDNAYGYIVVLAATTAALRVCWNCLLPGKRSR